MPLITDADLDFALVDMGVRVAFGMSSTNGMLRREDVLEQDDSGSLVTVSREVLVIRTGTLTLADDQNVTIDGGVYRVRKQLTRTPQLTRVTVVPV